jgi:hypothetical protein
MTLRSSLSCSSNPLPKSLPVNLSHFGEYGIATITVNTRVDKMSRKAFHVAQTARSWCRAVGASGVTERPTMAFHLLQTEVFGRRHNIEVATVRRGPQLYSRFPYKVNLQYPNSGRARCVRRATGRTPNSYCAQLMHRRDRVPSPDFQAALSGAIEAFEPQSRPVGTLSPLSADRHDRIDSPVPCKKLLRVSAMGTCLKVAMPGNAAG